jgi:tetratricopeptide (TPR) repeat protein
MSVRRCRNGHTWESVAETPCPACGASASPPTTAVLTFVPPTDARTLSGAAPPADDTRVPGPPGEAAPPGADTPGLPGYELLAYLGDGGMGRVYQARQVRLDRLVALKIVRPDRLARPGAVERFEREARAVAKLDHPNIVRIHDANQAGEVHFLVMEYLAGTDLSRMVDRRGPLPVAEACEYARQAALGLQHAHERGLVHRDIKPANLMVCGGVVKVLDLGLARLRAPDSLADDGPPAAPGAEVLDTLTRDGAVMGTPDYMAPEQAANTAAADIRADLYSLGCTLYAVLTGEVVFPGGDALDKAKRHATEEPRPLNEVRPEVPPRLAAVVARMMAKDPADRYQTPAEVAEALAPFCRPAARIRRRWFVAAGVFALAAGVAAAFAWPGKKSGGPEPPTPPSPPTGVHVGHPELARAAEATAAFERGKREFAARNTNAAVASLEQAVAADPEFWEAYAELGRVQVLLGRPDEALAALDRAVALRPDEWRPRFYRGAAYYDLRKDYARAAAEFTAAVDRGCREDAVWEARGVCRGRLGDWAGAEADLTEALRRAPGRLDLQQARANARLWQGEWGGAMADWGEVVRRGNYTFSDAERRLPRILSRYARGDFSGYRDGCRELVAEYGKTDNGRTAYLLARAAAQCPDSGIDPAEQVRLAALAAKSDHGWDVHTLALAQLRAGRPDEAIGEARRSLDPKTHWDDDGRVANWFVIALAELARGDRAAAVAAYRQVNEPIDLRHPHEVAGFILLKREVEEALGLAPPLAPEPRERTPR